MLTSIIILTYNKLSFTEQCIDSIRQYTNINTYELIVIDNNSTDGTKDWLLEQKDIKVILNEENLGFPKGCNQGIEISQGDNILLLNNDVIVTENWLDNLLESLYSHETIGAVGPVTNSAMYYTSIPVTYNNLVEMHDFASKYNKSKLKQWDERLKLIGYCMLIKKEVVDKIGLLDEQFTPGNFEDDDYSVRIRKAGYKLLLNMNTFIHHYGSVSWRDNVSGFNQLITKNEKKFKEKWGTATSSYIIHNDLINQLPFQVEDALTILHIGCNSGATLLQIKNKFKNAELYGLEKNRLEATEAEAIGTISNELENGMKSFLDGYFDAILITDWGLNNPQYLLKDVKRCLSKNGVLLAKMRNVSSHANIFHLLQGENPYNSKTVYFSKEEVDELLAGEFVYQFVNQQLNLHEDVVNFIQGLYQTEPKKIDEISVIDFIIKARKKDKFLIQSVTNILENKELDASLEVLISYSDEEVINVIKELSNQIEALNKISIAFYSHQNFDRVLPYLQAAYEMDSKNDDTNYNIAFILNSFGEINAAKNYIDLIEVRDSNAQELYEMIIDKLPLSEEDIRMILRRIEFGIDFDRSVEALNSILFEKRSVTPEEIIVVIERHIIHKVKVLNIIAINCFQNDKFEDILIYLNKAYELDREDQDTIYNLGFVLFHLKEYKAAMDYLLKISQPNAEVKQLIEDVLMKI